MKNDLPVKLPTAISHRRFKMMSRLCTQSARYELAIEIRLQINTGTIFIFSYMRSSAQYTRGVKMASISSIQFLAANKPIEDTHSNIHGCTQVIGNTYVAYQNTSRYIGNIAYTYSAYIPTPPGTSSAVLQSCSGDVEIFLQCTHEVGTTVQPPTCQPIQHSLGIHYR